LELATRENVVLATFSEDWTGTFFPLWEKLLAPLVGRRVSVLEVGSFEGRSALFFLEFLPRSNITCVDLFEAGFEALFDANVRPYANRLVKLKGPSATLLGPLADAGRRFDLIFIDGSHARDDVLTDSALSWPLLASDGILLWDDYLLRLAGYDEERPKRAIDAFLWLHRNEIQRLHTGWQVVVRRKRAEEIRRPVNLPTIRRWLRREPVPRPPINWRKPTA
jgi:predicted O-methyltransferase YrrM